MGIECRGLENFAEGQSHLLGKRDEMSGGNLPEGVLDKMQMLDQQIPVASPVAKKPSDLVRRMGIDLPPLWNRAPASASSPRMLEADDLVDIKFTHELGPPFRDNFEARRRSDQPFFRRS
jgi:hypothetical protein